MLAGLPLVADLHGWRLRSAQEAIQVAETGGFEFNGREGPSTRSRRDLRLVGFLAAALPQVVQPEVGVRLGLLEGYGVYAHITHGDGAGDKREYGKNKTRPEIGPPVHVLPGLRHPVQSAEALIAEIPDGDKTRHHAGAENEIGIVIG